MMKKYIALLIIVLLMGTTNAYAWMCPECNNEMNSKFCTECGTKQPENSCVSCGTSFGASSPKFCSECGAKVVTDNDNATIQQTASAEGMFSDVKVTITKNKDGTIATIIVDISGETKGIATPCAEEAFLSQFIGKAGPFTEVDVVTGATSTSNAVLEAVNSLFPANEATASAVGSAKEDRKTAAPNENAFKDIAPYIEYVGEVLNGTTLTLSSSENRNINNVKIAGIEGKVSYYASYETFNYIKEMKWQSNTTHLTIDDFSRICNAIWEYYLVDASSFSFENASEMRCKNDIYTIVCRISSGGLITVEWAYDSEQYYSKQVAGYIATQILRNKLKNPQSLQVHGVAYAMNAYCSECKDAIGIRIDYSAQNGFGGYNREYYYVLINPIDYTEVSTLLNPETILYAETFIPISVSNTKSFKKSYNRNMVTELITLDIVEYPTLTGIMDSKLMGYISYLNIPYNESGFTTAQAWDTGKSGYVLEEAVFLGQKCSIKVWYFDYATNGVANRIEIGSPASKLSLKELNELLSNNLNTTAYDISDSHLYMEIPDTPFEFQIFDWGEYSDANIYIRIKQDD